MERHVGSSFEYAWGAASAKLSIMQVMARMRSESIVAVVVYPGLYLIT